MTNNQSANANFHTTKDDYNYEDVIQLSQSEKQKLIEVQNQWFTEDNDMISKLKISNNCLTNNSNINDDKNTVQNVNKNNELNKEHI